MLDLALIREQPDRVKKAAADKQVAVDIDTLLQLDAQRRDFQQTIQKLQQQRNTISSSSQEGKPSPEQIEQGKAVKAEIARLETERGKTDEHFTKLHEAVPNLPSDDTPVGKDETDNVVVRTAGTKPSFTFAPKEHDVLGTALGLIDGKRAANVSGSRFTYLLGDLATLEFALVQIVLSVLTSKEHLRAIAQSANLDVPDTPFIPVVPPALIRAETLRRMARLAPKEERYHVAEDDLYLIGSAEHTMGAMHMDETLQEKDLPRRYIGFSSSFRREAGSYGKDVKGILRMHQFDKLEMESFTTGEKGLVEQNFLVAIQEYLMQQLGLPYQVVLCCTGDQGGPDARHLDIETWFPGQNRYRETHSADYMTDYQARRLATRVKRANGNTELVHMNDATAVAMGRTIAAILEHNQRADGSVAIPDMLRPYVGGRETFAAVP